MSKSLPTVTRLFHLVAAEGDSDGELLARFAFRRDEYAFASLVERHGPMVFAVCRRITGHQQLAEDAFQAAFLALARGAERVRDPQALSAWLYGAAVRVALKARRRSLPPSTTVRSAVADRPHADPLEEIS